MREDGKIRLNVSRVKRETRAEIVYPLDSFLAYVSVSKE